ncbi:S49 family peptidase [Rubrivivax gelatinosus]|uniref:Putative S49 family peptidase n=1 Tax=Rubrivivax gelatinosus (strain NBRC 100245 / IL144) TaxID=983917 RepID=I0HWN6_RUBGI|nr:S49 family peptidase [Rubrivivax gelatinosus]BAL97423.1 putative S49 family peptidase [Rubrivivax gelatinosus IL144]
MTPTDDTPTPAQPSGAVPPAPAPAAATAPALGGLETSLEKIARELMIQQRADRRWRIFFRFVWLALAVAIAWAGLSERLTPSAPSKPHTALVEVRGEIAPDTEASAELLVSALRSAFEDQGAQAVVLRINSPGGSPVQAGIVNDEIRRLKLLHKKKVYAVVEEMCASGAYYIAVAADEIYVDKASLVGSIGVLMDGFGFSGLMEKLGIERRLLTAGENKGMLDPYSPQNPKQTAYAQAMIDQIHQQFITVVRQGRGKRLHETPETFSGLFWNGEEAVRLGLADKMGNLDYVAREVVKAEDVVDYTPRENVAERLAKRFGAAMGEGAVKAMRQLSPMR